MSNPKEIIKTIYEETNMKNFIDKHVLIQKDSLKDAIVDYFLENNGIKDKKIISQKKNDLAILISNIEVEYE